MMDGRISEIRHWDRLLTRVGLQLYWPHLDFYEVAEIVEWEDDEISPQDFETLKNGKCPDCGAIDSMLEGPRGGLSQNIICEKCNMRFNICGPFGVQRIGRY